MKFELASSKGYDLSKRCISGVVSELYERVHVGTGIEDDIKIYYHIPNTFGRLPLAFVQTEDNIRRMDSLLYTIKKGLSLYIETRYWILSIDETGEIDKYQVKLHNKEDTTSKTSVKRFFEASEEFFSTLQNLINMDYTRWQTIRRVNTELEELQRTLKSGDANDKIEMILDGLEDVETDLY